MKPSFKQLCIAISVSLTLISCSGNGQSKKTEPSSKTSKPKAPAIDIHSAASQGNIEAVKQHIAAGTDLNMKDAIGGSSPLTSACLFGQKETAQLLIEAGANLNAQNNEGSTALHVAAFFCKPELVKLLLAKGIDKSIRNNYKNTAYETVVGPFAQVKPIYDQMQQMLGPIGVKIDMAYVEKTRPVVAALLK